MEATYAYSAWFFVRALCVIYLVAFLSFLPQAAGLWGAHGVLPMGEFMKAVEQAFGSSRAWRMPSVFWLSTSDEFIYGSAIFGAGAALLALVGFAQGWCLLICFVMYASFCNSGQEFTSFQWDALLCEVGFVALFLVPWNFDFSLTRAFEPHWLVRFAFYLILFKLMFLSGMVKILSGDESWRNFTAMDYHYWTQPLPNPLSPFMAALPDIVHRIECGFIFAVELVIPWLILWPRARIFVGTAFIVLSILILATGNYTFFNWLTIALCLWLLPDSVWTKAADALNLMPVPADIFPHPFTAICMGLLFVLSICFCLRTILPEEWTEPLTPVYRVAQSFHLSSSYGLFATMTTTRPEITIEGSDDGKNWKDYDFKFKPGPLWRHPPFVAPYQPRLDWQMWFAALMPPRMSPWFTTLLLRIFENRPEVMQFFVENPFPEKPPRYLRAEIYNYEFVSPDEIINNDLWWKRTLKGEFVPPVQNPSFKE